MQSVLDDPGVEVALQLVEGASCLLGVPGPTHQLGVRGLENGLGRKVAQARNEAGPDPRLQVREEQMLGTLHAPIAIVQRGETSYS